jgi:hypothetical protein
LSEAAIKRARKIYANCYLHSRWYPAF